MKKPATRTARRLLAKLEALAARPGTNGEADAVNAKLERLKGKFDFNAPAPQDLRDLFKGVFITTTAASPVIPLDAGALDVGSFVKWALESRCGVPCLFRDGKLWAQTNPATAKRLAKIATALATGFLSLWAQCKTGGANPADRGLFLRGMYDGAMGEALTGALPSRTEKPAKLGRAKKASVAAPVGVVAHPYSIAVHLGRQLALCVPVETLSNQLASAIRGEITNNQPNTNP